MNSNNPLEDTADDWRSLFDSLSDPAAVYDTASRQVLWQNTAWRHLERDTIELQNRADQSEGTLWQQIVESLPQQLSGFTRLERTLALDGHAAVPSTLAVKPFEQGQAVVIVTLPSLPRDRSRVAQDTDTLTGLPGRATLMASLESLFATTEGYSLLFVDLDGFKQINDGHGHLVGDSVLQQVASRLQQAMRTEDLITRFGGDEFVIVAYGVSTARFIEKVVERLHQIMSEPIVIGTEEFLLQTSIGVAHSGEEWTTPMKMIEAADRRMYNFKRQNSESRTDKAD